MNAQFYGIKSVLCSAMISLESFNSVLKVDSNIKSVFSKQNNLGNQQKAINCSCVVVVHS